MNDEDLRTLLASDDLSNLEKLSLEYYLEETLLNGSKVLDKSLDITQWTRLYKNPGSFIELLEKFAAFVVHLYDNDKIAIHPLLLFHHVTSTLSHNSTREEKAHNLITSIGGVHLMLSQIVEEFLALLDMTSRILGNKLDFLAEGPLDKQFYLDLLGPFIKDRNVEISKLERNSPLHIELTSPEAISLLSLLAAFLATRTKLEITKLRSTLEKRQPADKNKGVRGKKSEALMPKTHSRKTNQSLISFSSGMITKPTPAYEFRVKALIPGSLLMDLRLNFSTTFLRRLRGVLIDILVDSKRKRS
ncbi:MAG TPA: hypothetical protein VGO50_09805 [Pyrinomonadaceae bacterium]|nr:hypothetical protein [Pyrinomonadaceae bacterium]